VDEQSADGSRLQTNGKVADTPHQTVSAGPPSFRDLICGTLGFSGNYFSKAGSGAASAEPSAGLFLTMTSDWGVTTDAVTDRIKSYRSRKGPIYREMC
jgi:hypothetical protein